MCSEEAMEGPSRLDGQRGGREGREVLVWREEAVRALRVQGKGALEWIDTLLGTGRGPRGS